MRWFGQPATDKKDASAGAPPPRAPRHIALIMDGNGRWARQRGLPRSAGHARGAEALRRTLQACRAMQVQTLTVYAFSAENWRRPAEEIGELMALLKLYVEKELGSLHAEGVRVSFLGEMSRLPQDIRELLQHSEAQTAGNDRFQLNIALSYGARQEIAQAVRRLAEEVAQGRRDPHSIGERDIAQYLYTQDQPEPDLLIRTGGEQRLSNFLLWQSAYTELYFTDRLWPDFTGEDLRAAIADYAGRERRFGTTEAQEHCPSLMQKTVQSCA